MSEVKIRSFIAIELSSGAKEEVSRVLEELKKAKADVKWVKPNAVHLTLKFLGYVPEEKIPKIKECLEEVCRNFSPFDIALGGIGTFPFWTRPKVLWIGIGEGKEKVKSLAKEIEKVMTPEGFEKSSLGFKAHITAGRIKPPGKIKHLQKISNDIQIEQIASHIDKVILYKSDLTSEGAIHTPLAKIKLTG
jgi:2'-5' RNA ligase